MSLPRPAVRQVVVHDHEVNFDGFRRALGQEAGFPDAAVEPSEDPAVVAARRGQHRNNAALKALRAAKNPPSKHVSVFDHQAPRSIA